MPGDSVADGPWRQAIRVGVGGNTVRFRILGPFDVQDDRGRTVELGGPKQRAVLALLVINAGGVVALDRLIEELWGDSPPPTAAATLVSYVANLRRALEPERAARAPARVLVTRAPGYVLAVDPMSVDANVFSDLVARSRAADAATARRLLTQAQDVWRGPPLADFTYEEFAQTEIARLQELYVLAVERRIEADLALGNHAAVVPELEHLVRVHPLRERLWVHLMLALYRSGRQAEAVGAYAGFRETLVEHAGLDPSPALQQLEQRILARDPTLDRAEWGSNAGANLTAVASDTVQTRFSPALELVGRRAEMTQFEDALARAGRGRGTVLLLEGEPGIGKSRLLEAMVARARGDGVTASLARCVEVGGTPPYWPWIQIGRGLMRSSTSGALARIPEAFIPDLATLFPELRPRVTEDPSPVPAHRMVEGLFAMLGAWSAERPVVVAIDDLYGADPDSLDVLALLAGALDDLGVVVAGTYRSTGVPDDHRLNAVLEELSRQHTTCRMPLRPLTVEEVGRVMAQVTALDVDAGSAAAVHARTDGNAFFTVELSRLIAAESVAFSADAIGTFDAVPGSVHDVVRRRLARLPQPTVRALRVAAVYGREFDPDVVADITDLTQDELFDVVDLAMASGMVVESREAGHHRFAHVLVRDAIASGFGLLRRAHIHSQLADALEHHSEQLPERLADVAHHAIEAVPVAGVSQALSRVTRAARHALRSGAPAQAGRLLERRLELVATLPGSHDRDAAELDTLEDLLSVWTWTIGYHSERLVAAGERIAELAARLDSEHSVLAVLMGRWAFLTVRGRLDEAAEVNGQIGAMAERLTTPLGGVLAAQTAGILAVQRGRIATALDHFAVADDGEERLDPSASGAVLIPGQGQSVVVTNRMFSAVAWALAGEFARARDQSQEAVAAATRAGHDYSLGIAWVFSALVEAVASDHRAAGDAARRAIAICSAGGYSVMEAMARVVAGWADALGGRPQPGINDARDAIDHMVAEGWSAFLTLLWGLVAEAELASGRWQAATDAAQAGLRVAHRSGEHMWTAELEQVRAEAAEATGAADIARVARATSAEWTAALNMPGLSARADRRRDRPVVERP